MITFHNPRLAGDALCQLLVDLVPEAFHRPVAFLNTAQALAKDVPLGYRGAFYTGNDLPECIEIYLGTLYNGAAFDRTGSLAARYWKRTLSTCLHEFGHVATKHLRLDIGRRTYSRDDRARRYVEGLANSWRDRRLAELLDHDPRLAQPLLLEGYAGARLAQLNTNLAQRIERHGVLPWAVKERRCLKAQGQLTAGGVLRLLAIHPSVYPNAYRVLRVASERVGSPYQDTAGRAHYLYVWGDVPEIG